MMIVEDQPRLTIRQLQQMPEWPQWAESMVAEITACWGEVSVKASIPLATTELNFGKRWWCRCSCGALRYYLLALGDRVGCRGCAEGGTMYLQQVWGKRFREDTGLPALRAWRRLEKAA